MAKASAAQRAFDATKPADVSGAAGDVWARRLSEHDAAIAARPKPTAAEIEAAEARRLAERRADEMRRRKAIWDGLVRSGFGKRYAGCRLENYVAETDAQKRVVAAVQAYCEKPLERIEAGEGLMFYGAKGTGKDHLLASAAFEFVRRAGVQILWKNGEDLWGDVRDAMGKEGHSEAAWVDRLCSSPVLALSDPLHVGTQPLSDHQANMLFRILDRRYREQRPVWVTLNVRDRKEAEARIGAQIVDRLVGSCLALNCRWDSFRRGPVFGDA